VLAKQVAIILAFACCWVAWLLQNSSLYHRRYKYSFRETNWFGII